MNLESIKQKYFAGDGVKMQFDARSKDLVMYERVLARLKTQRKFFDRDYPVYTNLRSKIIDYGDNIGKLVGTILRDQVNWDKEQTNKVNALMKSLGFTCSLKKIASECDRF